MLSCTGCAACADGRLTPQPFVLLLRNSDLPRTLASYRSAACRSRQTAARQGALAERWFSVWLRDYHLVIDHGHLSASYRGDVPLRIRPITTKSA
jgi:hypothetical protein